MRKEILVTGGSAVEARSNLQKAFDNYIAEKGIKRWKWLIWPETKMRRQGQWRAYGRIEFDKG